jgi:hypothetical protein
VPLLDAVSGGTLPEENVLIVPYADRREAIGSDPLPEDAFIYYDENVWQALTGSVRVAEEAFAEIPAIPDAPARTLAGDWGVTDAGDLGAFMMRLRYTFARPTELLSNATGFWIAGALADAGWDPAAVRLPGLEAGFPAGLSGYPEENPPIPALPTATD